MEKIVDPWNQTVDFVWPGKVVHVNHDVLPMPAGADAGQEKWKAWQDYRDRCYREAHARFTRRAFDGETLRPGAVLDLQGLRHHHLEAAVVKIQELAFRTQGISPESASRSRLSIGGAAESFLRNAEAVEALDDVLWKAERWEPNASDGNGEIAYTETQLEYLRTVLDISANELEYRNASRWLSNIARRHGVNEQAVENVFQGCGVLPDGKWRRSSYWECRREAERIAAELHEKGLI